MKFNNDYGYGRHSVKKEHTYLHESLKLEELAMQIFKVLLEEVPEPVIKHDLDQHTESLLLWHLKKTKRFNNHANSNSNQTRYSI